eukprot:2558650-Rhodomonas_salina.8
MVKLCLDELDKSTVFLCFLGEKYGFRLDDVDELLPTRPWIESLRGKSMVEVELAAAVINNPDKFRNRAFIYMRNQLYIDSVPGAARGPTPRVWRVLSCLAHTSADVDAWHVRSDHCVGKGSGACAVWP